MASIIDDRGHTSGAVATSSFLRVSCFDQTVITLLPMLDDGCSVAGEHAKPVQNG